jgi:hypothetical protein
MFPETSLTSQPPWGPSSFRDSEEEARMLNRLIQLLEENEGEVDLATVSQLLDAQPSAVSGMLETLIRKGRVIELSPDCGVCDSCNLSSQCVLPARQIRRYQVTGKRRLAQRRQVVGSG